MTAVTIDRSDVCRRTSSWNEARIDFIPNSEFERGVDLQDPMVVAIVESSDKAPDIWAGLPAHLQRMCNTELLSFEQEQALFRGMNYRKYLAHQLRSQLDPSSAAHQQIAEIDGLLESAQTLRNHIVNANMRLVISIVKKFVTTQCTFDEMLSDGLVALLHCVDKFDFDRGFRFSTYAYRSIARELYRSVKPDKIQCLQLTQDGDESVMEPADERNSSSVNDGFWSHLRSRTGAMLTQLDRRERFIIRCRYALGSHRKVKSLQFLADKLGVSKERVRQLEIRAVGKLREMASEINVDDVIGSAVL